MSRWTGARFAEMKEVTNDKGPYKLARFEAEKGHTVTAQIIEPFGLQSSPMKGGQAILIPLDGDEGKFVALVLPPPKDRVDGQKEGETTLINNKTGTKVTMLENGNIEITGTADMVIRTTGTCHINPT